MLIAKSPQTYCDRITHYFMFVATKELIMHLPAFLHIHIHLTCLSLLFTCALTFNWNFLQYIPSHKYIVSLEYTWSYFFMSIYPHAPTYLSPHMQQNRLYVTWWFLQIHRYSEDELQLHIEKLHEYNEIKDVGQLLLGKIGKKIMVIHWYIV